MAMYRQRLYYAVGVWLLWIGIAWSAPDSTMSISPTATSGNTILASDENSRNNTIANTYNSHSHTDISQVATPLNVGASSGRSSVGDSSIVLEGSTNDAFETTISVTDPTADRTVTIPNATGTVLLDSDVQNQVLTGGSPLVFEGATDNAFETTISVTDPTADRTITIPNLAIDLGEQMVKGWVVLDGDASPADSLDSYNLTSITDNGTGDYSVTWATDFASANYSAVCTAAATSGILICGEADGGRTVTVTRLIITNTSGTNTDAQRVSVIAIGDQ